MILKRWTVFLLAAVVAIGMTACNACGGGTEPDTASSGGGGGGPAPTATPTPIQIFHDTFEAGTTGWVNAAANMTHQQSAAQFAMGANSIGFYQSGIASSTTVSDHFRRDFTAAGTKVRTSFYFRVAGLNGAATEPIEVTLELDNIVVWGLEFLGNGTVKVNGVLQGLNAGTIALNTWYHGEIDVDGTTITRMNISPQGSPQSDETGFTAAVGSFTPDALGDIIHIGFGDIIHDAGELFLDEVKILELP